MRRWYRSWRRLALDPEIVPSRRQSPSRKKGSLGVQRPTTAYLSWRWPSGAGSQYIAMVAQCDFAFCPWLSGFQSFAQAADEPERLYSYSTGPQSHLLDDGWSKRKGNCTGMKPFQWCLRMHIFAIVAILTCPCAGTCYYGLVRQSVDTAECVVVAQHLTHCTSTRVRLQPASPNHPITPSPFLPSRSDIKYR